MGIRGRKEGFEQDRVGAEKGRMRGKGNRCNLIEGVRRRLEQVL